MKKIIALALSIIMLLSMTACGAEPKETQPTETAATETTAAPFDIDDYKAVVSTCVESLYSSSVILKNVVTYEQNYWKSLEQLSGNVTSEKLLSAAIEWLSENSEHDLQTIQNSYDSNATMYKEIIGYDIQGVEAEEIWEAFSEYYDAYIALYNLAMTPNGNIDSFTESCNELIDQIVNSQSKMDILLS